MPTFDFQCRNCQNIFEFARPFGSDTKPACPQCKSKKTEKLITPPSIQFKGTGFYKNDARPAPIVEKKKEASAEAKKEASAAETPKAEPAKAKPAEKAAPKAA